LSPPSYPEARHLRRELRLFKAPIFLQALSQVATSIGGFFFACAGMHVLAPISTWMMLLLLPLAAGFLVRIFIIQHDCGHSSFFSSRRANDVLGLFCSILTLTPYASWRRQHNDHHAVWNDLARRQSGADIYSSCLTVAEYRALSVRGRRWFRITRNPFITNLLLPAFIFLILYRFPFDMPRDWRRERRAVHFTTLTIGCIIGVAGLLLGFEQLLIVQLPVLVLASIIGVWLFTVQHRGEKVRWTEGAHWSPTRAALEGSTYLCLPTILRWFTGNIGFHHVHHLEPRVPNYRLRECHSAIPRLQRVPAISFREAFRSMGFFLWDDESGRMVSASRVNDRKRHR
jgi:acyl-lipid omega-6 desaturase (Delta-12 desaturase)